MGKSKQQKGKRRPVAKRGARGMRFGSSLKKVGAHGKGLGAVWARVEAVGFRLERERLAEWEESAPLFGELMDASTEKRKDLVLAKPQFRTLAIVDRLLQAAELAGSTEAEELALLATEILSGLGAQRYGSQNLGERAVLARCAYAEARRRQGDVAGAERVYGSAARDLDLLPLSALARASFCRSVATLRWDQGREDEALGLLLRATDLFKLAEKMKQAAEALCRAAEYWLAAEEPEQALDLLRQAEQYLHPAEWPKLAVRIRHTLSLSLALLGEHDASEKELQRARTLYLLVDPIDALWHQVIEARIAQENGKDLRAVSILRPLVRKLLDRGSTTEAALAALELAKIYRSLERTEEIRWLIAEVLPLAETGGLSTATTAVLRFALRFAAREEDDSYELLAQAAEYLWEACLGAVRPWQWDPRAWTEVLWDEAPLELRQRMCEEAEISIALASQPAAVVGEIDRQVLTWMQQALHRVGVCFAKEG